MDDKRGLTAFLPKDMFLKLEFYSADKKQNERLVVKIINEQKLSYPASCSLFHRIGARSKYSGPYITNARATSAEN